MKNYFAFLLFALCCNIAIAQQNTTYPTIDIPYKIYTLDNGLTLIVSEDHKVPMVSFDIWYHVGSKNEKPGKTDLHICLNILCLPEQNIIPTLIK